MTNHTQNKFIYLPVYLSDYVSQSRKLTMLQRGALIDLSVLYFQENLKLSYTKEQIYRLVFAFEKQEQEAVDFILENYFIKSENKPTGFYWLSKELDELGDKILKRLNASRENGKKGGRGNKAENKPIGYPTGSVLLNLEKSILNESKLNEIKLKENKENESKLNDTKNTTGKTGIPKHTKNTDNDSDSDSDNKNDNVNNNINKSENKHDLQLPIFIDKNLFEDFIKMRTKIKKPLTDKAKELLIKDLIKFENNKIGNANIALENSIKSCWQGVFEPKAINQSKPSGGLMAQFNDPAIKRVYAYDEDND